MQNSACFGSMYIKVGNDTEITMALAQGWHINSWIFLFFFFFCIIRAALAAHGGSQARGPIGAIATSLLQSHSNARSEPHLLPTYTTAHGTWAVAHWARPEIEPTTSWFLVGVISTALGQELPPFFLTVPMVCGSPQVRDGTRAMAVTWTATVTTPDT